MPTKKDDFMNNRGMMTSLLTIGAAGAAIYGIARGVQNGTFQKLPQQVTNAVQSTFSNPNLQQATESFQNMMNHQNQGQQQQLSMNQNTTTNLQNQQG
ncbi:hypothetical protein [Oceanobacillus senegalensis]|uniref:hypothetical protein n=1 Tax=Oceanobacillus senegalensis TaxID=1936063 RepID=UPI001C4E8828|nr:hypothetical protein [Oceanobacillus senegalensis]